MFEPHVEVSGLAPQVLPKKASDAGSSSQAQVIARPAEIKTGICDVSADVLDWDAHKPPKTCLDHLGKKMQDVISQAEWDDVQAQVREETSRPRCQEVCVRFGLLDHEAHAMLTSSGGCFGAGFLYRPLAALRDASSQLRRPACPKPTHPGTALTA